MSTVLSKATLSKAIAKRKPTGLDDPALNPYLPPVDKKETPTFRWKKEGKQGYPSARSDLRLALLSGDFQLVQSLSRGAAIAPSSPTRWREGSVLPGWPRWFEIGSQVEWWHEMVSLGLGLEVDRESLQPIWKRAADAVAHVSRYSSIRTGYDVAEAYPFNFSTYLHNYDDKVTPLLGLYQQMMGYIWFQSHVVERCHYYAAATALARADTQTQALTTTRNEFNDMMKLTRAMVSDPTDMRDVLWICPVSAFDGPRVFSANMLMKLANTFHFYRIGLQAFLEDEFHIAAIPQDAMPDARARLEQADWPLWDPAIYMGRDPEVHVVVGDYLQLEPALQGEGRTAALLEAVQRAIVETDGARGHGYQVLVLHWVHYSMFLVVDGQFGWSDLGHNRQEPADDSVRAPPFAYFPCAIGETTPTYARGMASLVWMSPAMRAYHRWQLITRPTMATYLPSDEIDLGSPTVADRRDGLELRTRMAELQRWLAQQLAQQLAQPMPSSAMQLEIGRISMAVAVESLDASPPALLACIQGELGTEKTRAISITGVQLVITNPNDCDMWRLVLMLIVDVARLYRCPIRIPQAVVDTVGVTHIASVYDMSHDTTEAHTTPELLTLRPVVYPWFVAGHGGWPQFLRHRVTGDAWAMPLARKERSWDAASMRPNPIHGLQPVRNLEKLVPLFVPMVDISDIPTSLVSAMHHTNERPGQPCTPDDPLPTLPLRVVDATPARIQVVATPYTTYLASVEMYPGQKAVANVSTLAAYMRNGVGNMTPRRIRQLLALARVAAADTEMYVNAERHAIAVARMDTRETTLARITPQAILITPAAIAKPRRVSTYGPENELAQAALPPIVEYDARGAPAADRAMIVALDKQMQTGQLTPQTNVLDLSTPASYYAQRPTSHICAESMARRLREGLPPAPGAMDLEEDIGPAPGAMDLEEDVAPVPRPPSSRPIAAEAVPTSPFLPSTPPASPRRRRTLASLNPIVISDEESSVGDFDIVDEVIYDPRPRRLPVRAPSPPRLPMPSLPQGEKRRREPTPSPQLLPGIKPPPPAPLPLTPTVPRRVPPPAPAPLPPMPRRPPPPPSPVPLYPAPTIPRRQPPPPPPPAPDEDETPPAKRQRMEELMRAMRMLTLASGRDEAHPGRDADH